MEQKLMNPGLHFMLKSKSVKLEGKKKKTDLAD